MGCTGQKKNKTLTVQLGFFSFPLFLGKSVNFSESPSYQPAPWLPLHQWSRDVGGLSPPLCIFQLRLGCKQRLSETFHLCRSAAAPHVSIFSPKEPSASCTVGAVCIYSGRSPNHYQAHFTGSLRLFLTLDAVTSTITRKRLGGGAITVERSRQASLVAARRRLAETTKACTSSKRERKKWGKKRRNGPLTSLLGRQSAACLSEDKTACVM